MKIMMRTTSAGPDGVRHAGREYEVPAAEARVLVDGGFATSSEPPKPVKTDAKADAKGGPADDDKKKGAKADAKSGKAETKADAPPETRA